MTTDTNIDFKALHEEMLSLRGSIGLAASYYGCSHSHLNSVLKGWTTIADEEKKAFMHQCILKAISVVEEEQLTRRLANPANIQVTELTADPCPDYEEQFNQLKHQLDTVRVDLFKVAKQQEVTNHFGELTKMVGEIEGRVNSLNTKLHGIEVYLGHNMSKVSKSIERIEQHLKETEQPQPPPLNWFKRLFSK